ncbi:MAG: hypothetical protein OEM99_08885, partial [Gammaproteobacteria bacterium]|nr:hypothetical protein [Gammaproteobacteria bacterium]
RARCAALYFRKKRSHAPGPTTIVANLPALRTLHGHGIGVRARASCAAPRRRTPKQAELDLSEAGIPSEVKRERVPGSVPV